MNLLFLLQWHSTVTFNAFNRTIDTVYQIIAQMEQCNYHYAPLRLLKHCFFKQPQRAVQHFSSVNNLKRNFRVDMSTCSLKILERYKKCLRVSSSVKGKALSIHPSGRKWTKPQKANLGGDRMDTRIRILPLPSPKGHQDG